MGYTQDTRTFEVDSPLGKDVLLLRSFSGTEAISELFELEMASENDSISFDAMVGKKVTVRATVADEGERYWNGFVARFAQTGRDEDLTIYHATVVPWLWFLTETTNCKIFQNMTVPDIIYKVFGDLGFTDYEPRGLGSYPTREYCVQYRESAFNFVSRLMEEEGIFYFFEHEAGKHTMVLVRLAEDRPFPKDAAEAAFAGGENDGRS